MSEGKQSSKKTGWRKVKEKRIVSLTDSLGKVWKLEGPIVGIFFETDDDGNEIYRVSYLNHALTGYIAADQVINIIIETIYVEEIRTALKEKS